MSSTKDFADKLKTNPRKTIKEEPKNSLIDGISENVTYERNIEINDTSLVNNTDKYTHMYTDIIPTKETKSKRLNLLIYPSLHEDLERLAEMQAIKVNELINRVLKEYTELEGSKIMIENHKKITKGKTKRV